MGTNVESNGVQYKKKQEFDKLDGDDDPDTECGVGSFRPSFLQCFANVNAFVGTYSFIGMISQTLSVYVNSQVPALEKQFGLNSAESGLVMSFNDIGFFTTILFAASIVRFVHIPRFIYLCMILYGFSGIICSIPHFIAQGQGLLDNFYIESSIVVDSNNTMPKESKPDLLCDATRILKNISDLGNCATDSESKLAQLISPSISIKKTALGLIGIGMVLQGIGKAPRGAAFTVYVDDNVDRRKTGFYADVDMNPRDPRWIGAWWLGFLVFGAASLVLSTALLFFPRRLKQSEKDKAKGKKIIRTEEFHGTLKEKIKGWALSPILYGKIVDTTCLIWQSSCAGHGACEYYDIGDFRWKFHTFGFVFKMIALLVHCSHYGKFGTGSSGTQKPKVTMRKQSIQPTKNKI
ncbi:hypothetical protein FSP39_008716 [Pinctada imbricata]|uniref:Solute carrier organic anion transporter family member n=1 Tax=Pinctada imbricata TaxID=66713 RepID=A0AA88XS85_PINIB|nr:hypothetical protein FSP39_008716 [Pinctada imbricata]